MGVRRTAFDWQATSSEAEFSWKVLEKDGAPPVCTTDVPPPRNVAQSKTLVLCVSSTKSSYIYLLFTLILTNIILTR